MAAGSIRSADQHRAIHPAGSGFHHGAYGGHPGATREVARPLRDIAAQPSPLLGSSIELGNGRLRMAGKPSEPLHAAWYPPSTYHWDLGAKRSTGSGQMALWFSGYSCGAEHVGTLALCSAVREKFS